jgi:predicted Zn-dependent peptidase
MAVPALLLAAAVATWTVDAGTQGVLVEDHRAPVVAVTIEFPVGTWSPWTRAHGADVAFTRQDDDPDRALRKRADSLAASIDLTMGTRSATLAVRCLRSDLDASLALAKEVLTNTRYDEHELKRARREQAILWRGNETDVAFRMAQAAARDLFARDDPRRLPYEKPDPPAIDVAKLVAARDRLIRWPGRAIGFAGDLTLDEAEQAAHELLPAPGTAAPDAIAPRLSELNPQASRVQDRDIAMRSLTQVYLSWGRDSLPWTDPRRPAFLVADHVLGGHFYSRLYVALRHEAGDTYGAGTSDTGDVVVGTYAAHTFTRAENAGAIQTKLRAVLTQFRERGITEEERVAAVSYLRGNRAFDRQSSEQILTRWMMERRLGLAPGFLDEQVERTSTLSLDEINAFIHEFYDPARFSMTRAVPK